MNTDTRLPEMPSERINREMLQAVEDAANLWLPALPLLEQWRPEFDRLAGREQRGYLVAAVTGGVKVGKSTIANKIVGQAFSPVGENPVTRTAVIAKPAAISDRELRTEFADVDPTIVTITDPAWPDDVVLIDTPDYDSPIHGNAATARHILTRADVVIIVGSREKDYTSASLEWCKAWRDEKIFIMARNTGGDPAQMQDVEPERKRQLERIAAEGFQSGHLYFPELPADLQKLRRTLQAAGRRRQAIRQSHKLRTARALANDFNRLYEQHAGAIRDLQQIIRTVIHEPFKKALQDYDFQREKAAFARQLTLDAGDRIGGPMAMFLKVRRVLNPLFMTGLLATRWMPSRTGKGLVAASSLTAGFAQRMLQSWQDRKTLGGKHLRLGFDPRDWERLTTSARQAGFPATAGSRREDRKNRRATAEIARQIVQEVLAEKISERRACIDSGIVKVLWNLPLAAGLAVVIYRAGAAFLGFQPLNLSYYLHAAVLLAVVGWLESGLLTGLIARRFTGIGAEIGDRFLEHADEFGGGYAGIVANLESIRERIAALTENARLCADPIEKELGRQGLSMT